MNYTSSYTPPLKAFHIKPCFHHWDIKITLPYCLCSFDILHQVNFLISNLALSKSLQKSITLHSSHHSSRLFRHKKTLRWTPSGLWESLRAGHKDHQPWSFRFSQTGIWAHLKSYTTLSYEFWNGIFMLGQSQFLEMVVSQHFSFCTKKKKWGLNWWERK